jgi:hypothetical protein
MTVVRWAVRKVAVVAVLAVLGKLVRRSVPDISRYLKTRSM